MCSVANIRLFAVPDVSPSKLIAPVVASSVDHWTVAISSLTLTTTGPLTIRGGVSSATLAVSNSNERLVLILPAASTDSTIILYSVPGDKSVSIMECWLRKSVFPTVSTEPPSAAIEKATSPVVGSLVSQRIVAC